MIKNCIAILGMMAALAWPGAAAAQEDWETMSLKDYRDTVLILTDVQYEGGSGQPLPEPPEGVLEIQNYPSDIGTLKAYMTPPPGDGARHPAIIWITGGFSNELGEMWGVQPRANDQTAAQYREAGIVMMIPSLRGGNDNPGLAEGFVGEVDDILAAYDLLSQLPWVDPERIYLGGHSTGATLVMLVAETDDRFAGTFAFGPAMATANYGDYLFGGIDPDTLPEAEIYARAPLLWLDDVASPLFVIEGRVDGNIESLETMKDVTENPMITFIDVPSGGHFDILAPVNELIAEKILAGGPVTLTRDEVIAKMAAE